jgi:hypothetical protein
MMRRGWWGGGLVGCLKERRPQRARIGCRIIPGRIQTRRDVAGQWHFGYTAVRIGSEKGCGLRGSVVA